MKRRKFVELVGGSVFIAGTTYYAFSDKSNYVRADLRPANMIRTQLTADEIQIAQLASLAPSGHNTQPWLIKYIEPLHWIICNDKSKWLPAVDPTQRETILSIGAFIQNLEYAANNLGYRCRFNLVGNTNQDEDLMEVMLLRSANVIRYNIEKIIKRRTVRSNILRDELKTEDIRLLVDNDPDQIHFIPSTAKASHYLNEQTIEANRLQSYREPAQQELANWIRFSNKDAEIHRDGLTTGSMEIEGLSGWIVRNFYDRSNVMAKSFRDQNIEQVTKQVLSSGGWILLTSKDTSLNSLIETGKRMQRLFLKVREKNIAIHPMTQILEEPSIHQCINASVNIADPIQFILRTGYVKKYPEPVSLRRPVEQFIHTN